MLISHKHKLVIFTLQRTASQSIHSSISNLFDVSIDTRQYRHLSASDFADCIEPFLSEKYYKIAIYRNPIQRCISLYKKVTSHPLEEKTTFDIWYKKIIKSHYTWVSQYNQLTVNSKIYVDRLFDFDNINLFCNFLSSILETDIKLHHFGRSNKVHVEITDDVYNYMQSYYKKDIDLYKSIVDTGGELIINPYQSTP